MRGLERSRVSKTRAPLSSDTATVLSSRKGLDANQRGSRRTVGQSQDRIHREKKDSSPYIRKQSGTFPGDVEDGAVEEGDGGGLVAGRGEIPQLQMTVF